MRSLILVFCTLSAISCESPTQPDSIVASDTISYRVFGSQITGNVIIDYSTPTNGVITSTTNLAAPFNSGPITGFSQFIPTRPTMTITMLGTGCTEAQILRNAILVRMAKSCGPITYSVIYN